MNLMAWFRRPKRFVQAKGDYQHTQEECPHHLSWQTWGTCDGCGRKDTHWPNV